MLYRDCDYFSPRYHTPKTGCGNCKKYDIDNSKCSIEDKVKGYYSTSLVHGSVQYVGKKSYR